jgi:hypothetical protein
MVRRDTVRRSGSLFRAPFRYAPRRRASGGISRPPRDEIEAGDELYFYAWGSIIMRQRAAEDGDAGTAGA